jgi:hypothetical protein
MRSLRQPCFHASMFQNAKDRLSRAFVRPSCSAQDVQHAWVPLDRSRFRRPSANANEIVLNVDNDLRLCHRYWRRRVI